MEEYLSSLLRKGASHFGVSLDNTSISKLFDYKDLVSDWNRRMNLVSSRDLERFIDYHILDSLKVASSIDFSAITSFMDFGSGAGLPGIPLAIAFPHTRATLVDSRLKRTAFLNHAVESLPLPNVTVLRSRGEELPVSFNKSFDLVVTRATVKLPEFFHLAERFIPSGCSPLAVKGNSIDDELSALNSCADRRVFHISSTIPPHLENVRSGTLVTITRR